MMWLENKDFNNLFELAESITFMRLANCYYTHMSHFSLLSIFITHIHVITIITLRTSYSIFISGCLYCT